MIFKRRVPGETEEEFKNRSGSDVCKVFNRYNHRGQKCKRKIIN